MSAEDMASEEDIMVRIRSTDGRDYAMAVTEDMSVGELKARVRASTDIEEARQRLIYRGRVLQDDANSLSSYHIEHNHTIHLVARPVGVPVRTQQRGTSTATSATSEDAAAGPGNSGTAGNAGNLGNSGVAAPATGTVGAPARRLVVGAIAHTLLEDVLHAPQGVGAVRHPPRPQSLLGPRIREAQQLPSVGPAAGRLGGRASILSTLATVPGVGLRSAGPGGSNFANRAEENSLEHIRQAILTMRSLVSTMDIGTQVRTWEQEQDERLSESQWEVLDPAAEADEEKAEDGGHPIAEEKEDGGPAEDAKKAPEPTQSGSAGLEEWEMGSRTFFVGQWLDVKDTVNQWLEATVMDVRANSLFIHYNGWPTRWDEWIDADSSRLAPFRTRTLHSASAPFNSPSPNNRVVNAPTTGGEDFRSVIPEVYSVFMRCAPALGALSRMCEEDLEDEALNGPLPNHASRAAPNAPNAESSATEASGRSSARVAPGMPWEAEQAREIRVANRRRKRGKSAQTPDVRPAWASEDADFEAEEDGEKAMDTESKDDSTPAVSEERLAEARRRRRHVNAIARQLGPLLDRLGRAVADLAPHVSNMVDEGPEQEEPLAEGEEAPQTAVSADGARVAEALPTPDQESVRSRSVGELFSSPRARRRGPGADVGLQRLQSASGRRNDNNPERSFERLISTPARAGPLGLLGGGGNVDIHIHAIVPLRNPEVSQADAPSPAVVPTVARNLALMNETAALLRPASTGIAQPRVNAGMPGTREAAPAVIAGAQPGFVSSISPLHHRDREAPAPAPAQTTASNAAESMEDVADDNQDTGLEIPSSAGPTRRSEAPEAADDGAREQRSSGSTRPGRSPRTSAARGRRNSESNGTGIMGRISSMFRRPSSSSSGR